MTIQSEKAVEFLQSLIRINSVNPPGNELEVANAIAEYAEASGLGVEIKKISNSRANIIVRLAGKDPKLSPLIFSGHLDTVPIGARDWKHNPFSGKLIEGKIYGRGACDMKGGVASIIEAMILLKNSGNMLESDIVFVGTCGEEVDCIGAKALIKEGTIKNAGAIIIAEPSNNKVFSAHKGVLWIEIKVFGSTAHGSMPEEGINAILHMSELLERIKKLTFLYGSEHDLLGVPTLNIGTINGGITTNVVPDQCTLTIDIRTIPEIIHENIISEVKTILLNLENEIENFQAELKILNNLPAVENSKNEEFVQLALKTNYDLNGTDMVERGANYYTDGSIFSPALNVPIIIYGPGNEKLAHQPNEYIEISQYLKSISYYVELAKRFTIKK